MPIHKTSRKVQLFGSSLALTIPSLFAKVSEIEKGKRLNLFYDLDGTLVIANCGSETELKTCLLKFVESLEKNLSKKSVPLNQINKEKKRT